MDATERLRCSFYLGDLRLSDWLRGNWWKVVLVAVVAATAYRYSRHLDHLEDLERRKVSADSAVAAQRESARALEEQAHLEQQRKEYLAKRRTDCFSIYDKEKRNWSNVSGVDFDETDDECRVIYKQNGSRERCVQPDSNTAVLGTVYSRWAWRTYLRCKDNEFERVF